MENVSTGVLDKTKQYQPVKIKPKNHMMHKDIYNWICQKKTKKMKIYNPRFTIQDDLDRLT